MICALPFSVIELTHGSWSASLGMATEPAKSGPCWKILHLQSKIIKQLTPKIAAESSNIPKPHLQNCLNHNQYIL